MSMVAEKSAERERQIADLKKILPKGSTVYTVVKHVARSGMMRRIMPFVIVKGEPRNISHVVSEILGWTWADDGSIKVHGCGMDMTFHLVHKIAEALYEDGYKLNNRNL